MTQHPAGETVTDDTFTVRHTHPAPRGLVFTCLTTPAHLAEFWGPSGTHTSESDIVVDLQPGGAFETTMVNDLDGRTHTMRAVYVVVDDPGFLSWREVDTGVVTELTLTALDDRTTEVVTTQRHLPPHFRTPQARAGWSTALDRAAAYIAELSYRRTE